MASGDLITLTDFKNALGTDLTDTTLDPKYAKAITDASEAIRTFLERDVGLPLGSAGEQRTYNYTGDGILEIDDCAFGTITAVVLSSQGGAPVTLSTPQQYIAEPDRKSPVHDWLRLVPRNPMSPAMGFTWNADTLYGLYGAGLGGGLAPMFSVAITATFGWPTVPSDIQRAAILTTAEFQSTPLPIVSRHFESYSEQYAPTNQTEAIPPRAQALLEPWARRKL